MRRFLLKLTVITVSHLSLIASRPKLNPQRLRKPAVARKKPSFVIRSLAPVVALLLCATTVTLAQTNTPKATPNFSGTWKLNLQRSGPIMPRGLEALTLVIDH